MDKLQVPILAYLAAVQQKIFDLFNNAKAAMAIASCGIILPQI